MTFNLASPMAWTALPVGSEGSEAVVKGDVVISRAASLTALSGRV